MIRFSGDGFGRWDMLKNWKVGAEGEGESEVDPEFGELQVAEYIVFLLALDTYMRYLDEAQSGGEDDLSRNGIRLLRMADTMHVGTIGSFLRENLPSEIHKKMLERALKLRPSPEGASRRALMIRTLLSRGGASTMRAVFKTNKALREVKEAISASMMDNADVALDIFVKIPLHNARVKTWIKLAAETAVTVQVPANVVEIGSKEAQDQKPGMLAHGVQQLASQGADASKRAQDANTEKLLQIQDGATSSARKAMEQTGEVDAPLTKSEVVGVAVAAATAAMSDPSNPQNVPEPLRSLDDEQRSAALTDGKVAVFAGAGSGKSTTLVARVAYLVKDRRVNPSRILVTSFNTKAASELKTKIGRAAGAEALQQMIVGTMHSLFRRFINDFGTPTERASMGEGFVGSGSSNSQGNKNIASTVQYIWEECYGKTRPVPKLKSAMMFMARWSGNDISPAQAADQASTKEEADAALWYEMYEGLKGTNSWRPPCKSSAYDRFMVTVRKSHARLGDFTDMLKIFRDILKRDPAVRKKVQGMFDHIIVDEAQDRNTLMRECVDMMSEQVTDGSDGKSIWFVGDDKQCVAVDTLVSTPSGVIPAGDLRVGQQVLAFKNAEVVSQSVLHVKPSDWTWGL